LVFGVMGPAGAATQDVSYALGTGTVTVGDTVYNLPASTGIVGTWDDVSGDFSGVFSSTAVQSSRAVAAPIPGTITLNSVFVATTDLTGNIDPATGLGTLGTTFDVVVTLESLAPDADPTTPIVLDQICTIAAVPVTYNVTATGLGVGSEIFTDLSLTANPFNAPAATCVAGPAGNPALTPLVEPSFNTSAGLPTDQTASALTFVAGAIPPPPSTTTTTIVTPTTAAPTTTAPPAAPPATPVGAAARFTG